MGETTGPAQALFQPPPAPVVGALCFSGPSDPCHPPPCPSPSPSQTFVDCAGAPKTQGLGLRCARLGWPCTSTICRCRACLRPQPPAPLVLSLIHCPPPQFHTAPFPTPPLGPFVSNNMTAPLKRDQPWNARKDWNGLKRRSQGHYWGRTTRHTAGTAGGGGGAVLSQVGGASHRPWSMVGPLGLQKNCSRVHGTPVRLLVHHGIHTALAGWAQGSPSKKGQCCRFVPLLNHRLLPISYDDILVIGFGHH